MPLDYCLSKDFMTDAPTRACASGTSLTPTIFHESWWMEAASYAGTQRESVCRLDGKVVGRLPYIVSRRGWGLTVAGMPSMTHVLGPALREDFISDVLPRSLKQIWITRELIDQLPPVSHISFRLHGGVNNTLAFEAAGFSSHVEYTVEIPPAADDVLWRQMRDKTRNVIRRAQEQLTVTELTDASVFLDFYEANLRDRRTSNLYDPEICSAVITESIARGVGRILGAIDASGNMQAAIFTVWDRRCEYYFMSTRGVTSLNGAICLLIWSAIRHAAGLGLIFDMDKVHVQRGALPNLLLLTGFGGSLQPRYFVRRTSPVVRAARDIVHWAMRTG